MNQDEALTILKTGRNVFLTGPAGSGKTYTLNSYIRFLKESGVPVAVTASTGIASTHLGGVTIHSWSGLGIRDTLGERDIDELESRQYLWKRYEKTKVLIIDEVSMLHHFRLDLIDKLCRSFKRNDTPFGGMQVVLCGDFFQLPPVTRGGEPSAHFVYRARAWNEMNLRICYLQEQYRQSDNDFISVLNNIRSGAITEKTRELLTSRHMKDPECSVPPTKLFTHNENVDSINERELSMMPGSAKTFAMGEKGRASLVESLKKSCLAPEALQLKKGARVMFVKNNFEKGYVNGTLGAVDGFSAAGNPLVRKVDGEVVEAEAESWRIEEDGKVKAEISQVPLRLAWAITVHKSQGMSLDAAEVDLSRSFVAGMGYVALSRVKSLSGLKILGLNETALAVNREVIAADVRLRELSNKALSELEQLGKRELERLAGEFLKANALLGKAGGVEKDIPSHHKTKELILKKLSLDEIASERDLKKTTVVSHIESLLDEGEDIDIEYIKKASFQPDRFEKIKKAFLKSYKKHGDTKLSPVKSILGAGFSYDELRLARLFVDFG